MAGNLKRDKEPNAMTAKPAIWCLFSVENNYDQPNNNLVRWWTERPTIETLAKYLDCPLDKADDADVVAVVEVWKGNAARVRADTSYRLQRVEEGEAP